jgi:hypothetical protein
MSDAISQTTFAYDALDEITRAFLLRKTDETRGLLKRTAQNIVLIGRHLQEVKGVLPYGHFLAWLHAEFAMTERHARNFMHVAARFGDRSEIISDLSVTVIYELAAPSTSEAVIARVVSGEVPPTVSAIRAAKQAEQEARKEAAQAQRTLFALQEDLHAQEATIAALKWEQEALQKRLRASTDPSALEPINRSPELLSQLEALQQQVQRLTRERETLAQQVAHLGEEARAAALKREEGEQERHIRLNWYRITTSFQASLRSILTAWPLPLDTQAFEADDWHRLTEIKALARRFLAECEALTSDPIPIIVESAPMPMKEGSEGMDQQSDERE